MDKGSIRIETKENSSLPAGSEVINKRCDVSVREIENGFIVRKSYDIEYMLEGQKQYKYFTTEVYSEKNPIKIESPKVTKRKSSLLDEIEKM